MIPRRQVPLVLAQARRCRTVTHRYQHSVAAVPAPRRSFSSTGSHESVTGMDENPTDSELMRLEEDYATLKVNWFPGHMVKATKVIREKLKQVDMVFEVRDARIPFTSANEDLDKIVGPSKARLIVLNKADLSNQALEQRVLQRFKEQGKAAVYACGRTGTNVNKLLAWARERGARRGEFSTTGAIAMVVGMPNVGKSSLINLLRGKANRGGGGGGDGEGAKQVARVGAMPGVTRQVSAFRIASNPPLYLVDTPGVMVPRVESKTAGLFLALTRAVPDSAVPSDVLVGFMLRVVRSRRSSGARDRSVTALSAPRREDDMEALLEAVERESGAEGKPAPEARRICCRFLLDAFRDGQFGRITLDSVPRRRVLKTNNAAELASGAPPPAWAQLVARRGEDRGRAEAGPVVREGRRPSASPESDLAERLVRDWSSADAWERADADARRT
ncbi:Mtg1, mitochondrial YlqF-like GTPase [Ectocarpus siliculosus]|uniref:Mtg1, mitochondrial YlqF-like GTPase n=1 Tax=Ectocarpus siliculosus TaxID=2880 RepID=D8LR15_ECTSI|nr:Mtg1, mitochondrial YlqF-like GTPase [Ectocarpus siliculosus]|eukprot:CBN77688.1 Mtg1, mitochondrial YlqF-like GTPase [Ectocarpus siliculosus]